MEERGLLTTFKSGYDNVICYIPGYTNTIQEPLSVGCNGPFLPKLMSITPPGLLFFNFSLQLKPCING